MIKEVNQYDEHNNLHGICREYYDYEKKILSSEKNYEHGVINGLVKIYWLTGKPMAEYFIINGKTDGVFKKFHENGALKEEKFYKNGKANGPCTTYSENGNIRSLCELKDSKREGVGTGWRKKDKTHLVMFFMDGEPEGEMILMTTLWYRIKFRIMSKFIKIFTKIFPI